jgi:hypothetical protein
VSIRAEAEGRNRNLSHEEAQKKSHKEAQKKSHKEAQEEGGSKVGFSFVPFCGSDCAFS